MQLKIFCCSCFFDVMLKVKTFSSDLIRKAADGDIVSCFKLCSFLSQCNVQMERLIFIKFGHDDGIFICYKCFVIHISFLEEDLVCRLKSRCYRFRKVSNDCCLQSLKKHYIDYQDICYGWVAICNDYMLEMFYLRLVSNSCNVIKLFEIVLALLIVLVLILKGHTVCLACILVSAICLTFILSIGFIIILFFRKSFKT